MAKKLSVEKWLDDGVEVAVVLGLAVTISILLQAYREKAKLTFAKPMKVSLPSGLFGPAFLSSFSIVVSTRSGGGGGTGGPFLFSSVSMSILVHPILTLMAQS